MASKFDIRTAGSRFPALKQDQVYFDNAGGSQVLDTVITSIQDYLTENNVQLGASYAVGKKSTAHYSAGYAAAAKYINASTEEIVLGSSTTQLFRNLSYALNFNAGDEIVVSMVDHEANIAPWVALAQRQKLVLKWWKPTESSNPKLLPEELMKLISANTRLVTCTHASNILGTIHDIKEISEVVHSVPGALLCVDAVAYAPHRRIDVKSIAVDFYSFTWYKVYGPHISILYASTKAQEQVSSLGHYFNPQTTLENKLGLAGSNYELVNAIPAVLDYFGEDLASSWSEIAKHEQNMQEVLLSYLRSRKDVTILGESSSDPKLRVSTVSFVIKGYTSQEVVEKVEQVSNFGFRWGFFYSNRLATNILKLDCDGAIRVSMVHYNTVDEISRFVKTIDEVIPTL